MKKNYLLLTGLIFLFSSGSLHAQSYFLDNFDAYTAGSWLGQNSSSWTTWTNNPGGSDDVRIANNDAYSGSNSIYFNSPSGNGPNDVVLDFGGVYSSGRFKYTMMMKIPSNRNAYFNFQGGAGVAQLWAMECYLYSGGSFSVDGGRVSGTFPHDQWFELVFDCDLDNEVWEVFVDGVSQGSYNNPNPISYLDLFPANSNSEWWVDDVSFCTNFGCNPELELSNLSINPSTICTHEPGDLTVTVKNNSSFSAQEFEIGILVGNSIMTSNVDLNNLNGGEDTILTLSGVFNSPIAGNNVSVKAFNNSRDIDASNDTAATTVDVLPSPSGSVISKSTPFDSPQQQTPGTMADPDITADGGTLTYEIIPPNGFANSAYGNTWNMGTVSFQTVNGTTINSSYYSVSAPGSSSNGEISFSPDTALTDSLIVFSFTVNDLGNGCDTFMARYIQVVPRPDPNFSFANVCDLEEMTFNNTSAIRSGFMTYRWEFGDGDTSVLTNPTHTYNGHGTYDVKLYATSDYGYVDSSIQTVEVFELPQADFSVDNACEGEDLTFTDNSLLPTGNPSYAWDFGDGIGTDNVNNPTYQYANPGSYVVTMTVEVNGCEDQATHYATQAPRAVPAFSSNSSCNNTEVSFSNNTTLSDGTFGSTWKFGDGTSGNFRNATHDYNGFGNFDVTLVVTTNLGCMDSITNQINVIDAPEADFTLSNACSDEDIVLNNQTNIPVGGVNVYEWTFHNGAKSSASDPTVHYNAPGTYAVKLVVQHSNGCADSISRNVIIDTRPIGDFGAEDVCEGEPVVFDNLTINIPDGASYLWDFGNGMTSMAEDTSLLYANAQAYDVSLFVSSPNGCVDTVSRTINVNEVPDATFIANSGYRGDGTMSFSGPNGSGYNYQWFMGDGSRYTNRDIDHRYNLDGSYEVKLVVTTDAGCISQTTQMVDVYRTGIDLANVEIKVYPNPTSGLFHIELGENNRMTGELQLINSSGKIVKVQQSAGRNSLTVNTQGLAKGVYVVRVPTSSGILSKQLVLVP